MNTGILHREASAHEFGLLRFMRPWLREVRKMLTGDVGLYGERLAVLLGYLTFGLFVGMGLTCRNFVSLMARFGLETVTASAPYQAVFRLHPYFWYGLVLVLPMHMFVGILHTELPVAGDPDELIHWLILIFGGSTLLSVALVFSNCRSCASVLKWFRSGNIFAGVYGRYYQFHAWFWIILLLALAGHLAASYAHVGFWPTQLE